MTDIPSANIGSSLEGPAITNNPQENAPTQEGAATPAASEQVLKTAEKASETLAIESESSYHEVLSKVKAQQPSDDAQANVAQDASDIHAQADRETQINHLLELVVAKGLNHAVTVAEHLNDYYVMDTFHDKIIHDEFHTKLVESGVLKN